MVKHLRRQPPCACKSLMLKLLQEVSEIQTTRRDVVEKSLSQKVFLLTIFHGESVSFFIYFQKYFFHQSPLYCPPLLYDSEIPAEILLVSFTFSKSS
jgi:hypothetical protein